MPYLSDGSSSNELADTCQTVSLLSVTPHLKSVSSSRIPLPRPMNDPEIKNKEVWLVSEILTNELA